MTQSDKIKQELAKWVFAVNDTEQGNEKNIAVISALSVVAAFHDVGMITDGAFRSYISDIKSCGESR